jgi:hypothetical protein
MDANLLFDCRFALFSGMLFTSIIAITAEEPETVPAIFRNIWRRYMLYQEVRRMRSPKSTERFWEIDMTNLEP